MSNLPAPHGAPRLPRPVPSDESVAAPAPQLAPTPAGGVFGVIIADDDPNVRQALADLCDERAQLTVVGTAASGDEAAELCRRLKPDLAVVDVVMPSGGAVAVAAILAASPTTAVVAYTARDDRRTRDRMLASGALAVFTKGTDVDLASAFYAFARRGRGQSRE